MRSEIPDGATLLEIGPQDISAPRHIVEQHFPDAAPLFINDAARRDCQADFYALMGVRKYMAVDLFDDRAVIRHDMNRRLITWRRDVVTNFGTAEHVFDVARFFANIHSATKRGGLMLHAMPAFGDINHGFYNFHPVMIRGMAVANDYEVLDFTYVDNIANRACAEQSLEDLKLTDVFDTLTSRHTVFNNLLKNAEADETREFDAAHQNTVFDYSFVALRKTTNGRFRIPL
jgi:hypothetical protein